MGRIDVMTLVMHVGTLLRDPDSVVPATGDRTLDALLDELASHRRAGDALSGLTALLYWTAEPVTAHARSQ